MRVDLSKYNSSYFENASLEELESEREHVRADIYCNDDVDEDIRIECYDLLNTFDNYIRDKKYGKDREWTPPKSTRHGWYLEDDDDD